MNNLADLVLDGVLKKVSLSDKLLEFLYLLLLREEKDGYASFYNAPKALTQEYVDIYVYTIIGILKRLPDYTDSSEGLRVSVQDIIGWSHEDIYETFAHLPFEFRPPFDPDLHHLIKKFTLRDYGRLWRDILDYHVGIRLPVGLRNKHTHIIGGTGAGKTVLLEQLISYDLETDASIIVIDSKGDFFNRLKHSKLIDPERLVIIDPEDSIMNPLALNIFDIGNVSTDDPVAYAQHINNVLDLLNFIFSSILDSDLTGKQDNLLDYCCSLMLRIPNATIQTLHNFLSNGLVEYPEYQSTIDTMPDVARNFFAEAFATDRRPNQYKTTKGEVKRRLESLLRNSTISSLFTSPQNRLNLSKEMNEGKVILISTKQALLGESGTAFFGRFFIALIDQVSLQRANQPEHNRRKCYVYIDECGDYLKSEDSKISSILDKGRSANIGLTLAHQRRGQLPIGVYDAIKANTNIRIAGSPDEDDLFSLKKLFHIDSIPSHPGRFALYTKGSSRGVEIKTRLNTLDDSGVRTDEEMEAVMQANRAKYCIDYEMPLETPGIIEKHVKSDEAKGIPDDPLAPYT